MKDYEPTFKLKALYAPCRCGKPSTTIHLVNDDQAVNGRSCDSEECSARIVQHNIEVGYQPTGFRKYDDHYHHQYESLTMAMVRW